MGLVLIKNPNDFVIINHKTIFFSFFYLVLVWKHDISSKSI